MAAIADPPIAAKAAPTINTLVFRQLLGFLLHKHPDQTQRYSLRACIKTNSLIYMTIEPAYSRLLAD